MSWSHFERRFPLSNGKRLLETGGLEGPTDSTKNWGCALPDFHGVSSKNSCPLQRGKLTGTRRMRNGTARRNK